MKYFCGHGCAMQIKDQTWLAAPQVGVIRPLYPCPPQQAPSGSPAFAFSVFLSLKCAGGLAQRAPDLCREWANLRGSVEARALSAIGSARSRRWSPQNSPTGRPTAVCWPGGGWASTLRDWQSLSVPPPPALGSLPGDVSPRRVCQPAVARKVISC